MRVTTHPGRDGRPDEHVPPPGTAAPTCVRPLGYRVDSASGIFAHDTADRPAVLDPLGSRPAEHPVLARKEST